MKEVMVMIAVGVAIGFSAAYFDANYLHAVVFYSIGYVQMCIFGALK